MKNILTFCGILLPALIIISCRGSKLPDHYSGFVTDETGVPIQGVLVREDFPEGNKDTTDRAGYFMIERTGKGVHDLIFSKKGYYSDTLEMVCLIEGEKDIYSHFVTTDSSRLVMSKIYRDSTLNWSDKLRIYENDSIEMYRDARLMYTRYPGRGKGETIYKYYNYYGKTSKEVYNINTEPGQIHFRSYERFATQGVENIGYLYTSDSIPSLLKGDWGEYWSIGVIKEVQGKRVLSETYILWRSHEDFVAGRGEDYIGKQEFLKDSTYHIKKYLPEGTVNWIYYPDGKLRYHWDSMSLYGGNFSTFSIWYDPSGRKTEETTWENLYPEWGMGYNSTFSVGTTRKYYQSGSLKSLTKTKSFCESGGYRCGTWYYYSEDGRVLKTEKYGDCYNFELEEEYEEGNFT